MDEVEIRVARALRELTDALPVLTPAVPATPLSAHSAGARRRGPVALLALAAASILVIAAVAWRVADRDSRPSPPIESVQPTPTAAPTTVTASMPTPPSPRWILMDSTMSAAATSTILNSAHVTTATTATADLADQVSSIRSLVDRSLIGPVVIVHVGTDGPLPAGALGAILEGLAGISTVVLATDHGQAAWTAANNAEISAAAATHPAVSLFDWATIAPKCAGECFTEDGLGLTDDGAWYYAEQLAAYIGFTLPPRPTPTASLPIMAVTDQGAAVMVPAGEESPITLFTPPPGSSARVNTVVLTDDDRAAIATCCEPLSGETFLLQPSVPDEPPTHAAYAAAVDFGDASRGFAYALPEGFRVGNSLTGDGLQVTVPATVGNIIDVAWLDGLPAPPASPFNYAQGQLAALSRSNNGIHLITASDIARTNPLDHHTIISTNPNADIRLAGTTTDGLVAVFDPSTPDLVTAYNVNTLNAERTIDLPSAARSAWLQGTNLIWVDHTGTLHNGDETIPGTYTWARR